MIGSATGLQAVLAPEVYKNFIICSKESSIVIFLYPGPFEISDSHTVRKTDST